MKTINHGSKILNESTHMNSILEQMIIKLVTTNNKKNCLEQPGEKNYMKCIKPKIGMTVELSLKTVQMRNQRNYIGKVLKGEKQLEFHIQRKYITKTRVN